MTTWETRFCRTVYNQNLSDVNLASIRLSYTISPPSHSCASQLPPANSTNKSTQLVVYIGTFTCFTTYLRSKKDHCEVSCHRRDRELADSQRRTPTTSHPRARPSQPSLNSVGFYSECPHQHHAPCLRLGLYCRDIAGFMQEACSTKRQAAIPSSPQPPGLKTRPVPDCRLRLPSARAQKRPCVSSHDTPGYRD
jgi:hypothetical protein